MLRAKRLKVTPAYLLSFIFLLILPPEVIMSLLPDQKDPQKVQETLSSFLPLEIKGWQARSDDELYTPETIFDYIDGAGEVYRSYGFRWLLVRRYEREAYPPLIVDLFEMGNPADAFGVFTHELEGESVPIGREGVYKGGWLAFWKDRFYVSVLAEEETPETRQAVLALGQEISRAIPGEGEKPALLRLLPEEGEKHKVRYFHNHHILNYHFFVATDNLFDLDETTEAVLVRMEKPGQQKMHLLVILYPDEARARKAIDHFLASYLPEAGSSGIDRTEDGLWTGAKAEGKIGVAVFGATSAEEVRDLIARVLKKGREIRFF